MVSIGWYSGYLEGVLFEECVVVAPALSLRFMLVSGRNSPEGSSRQDLGFLVPKRPLLGVRTRELKFWVVGTIWDIWEFPKGPKVRAPGQSS